MNIYVRHVHSHVPVFFGQFDTKIICLSAVNKLRSIGLDGFVEMPSLGGFNNTKSFFHNEEFEL